MSSLCSFHSNTLIKTYIIEDLPFNDKYSVFFLSLLRIDVMTYPVTLLHDLPGKLLIFHMYLPGVCL